MSNNAAPETETIASTVRAIRCLPSETQVHGSSVMVSTPDHWIVYAGEYPDTPDLLIRVEHAVGDDGRDLAAVVAVAIRDFIAKGGLK